MLGWLTGSLRPTDAQYSGADDGASHYDEPPETPAPLFAVRAFKTALFGTPHPQQSEIKHPVQPKAKPQSVGARALAEKPKEKAQSTEVSTVVEKLNRSKNPIESGSRRSDTLEDDTKYAAQSRDPLASPAKGILLTPGTAATRRKTVSFGNVEANGPENADQPAYGTSEVKIDRAFVSEDSAADTAPERKPRQSTLTRTLIELSKQSLAKEQPSTGPSTKEKDAEGAPSMDFRTDSVLGSSVDVTVDLSQPRSRSGQHWKTEYDQYHRRSNREMKKIIKYGQNVKSYAVKKDSEATSLSEKLKRELAKVAVMEVKVSKLAMQLSNAQFQAPDGESDHRRLVSELAQQTALAIKYEERAAGFRAALEKQGVSETSDELPENPETETRSVESPELATLRVEFDALCATATAAKNQATKLEKENATLKRSLARVKEEMMSYESRRQAREERFKKREAKHKAAREECEMRLAQLTVDHEELLRASGELPVVDMVAEIQSIQKEAGIQDRDSEENQDNPRTNQLSSNNQENTHAPASNKQTDTQYISPRKRRLQKPTVDIWTLSSPPSDENKAPPSAEPTSLPPSSVKHSIHRTLREIDQNLVPAKPNSDPNPDPNLESAPSKPNQPSQLPPLIPPQPTDTTTSATRHMNNRHTRISSPRPSMISLASSPAKMTHPGIENAHLKPSAASTGRSASLLSRVGSRTSSMGSGRVSSLSLERAEAAKARLARRSAEKRGKRES